MKEIIAVVVVVGLVVIGLAGNWGSSSWYAH